MDWRVRFAVLLAGVCACGPRAGDRADLDLLCGEEGPIRILPLAPNEAVVSLGPLAPFDPVTRVGDHFVAVVHTYASGADPFSPFPEDEIIVESRVVSAGACGDDVVTMLDAPERLNIPDDPEDPWLACATVDGTYGLYRLDPTGDSPPVRLRTQRDCPHATTVGDDVFVIDSADDEPSGPLVGFDHAGVPHTIVAGGVSNVSASGVAPSWAPDVDRHLLVALETGQLLDLSLDTGASETIASDVDIHFTQRGGRYLRLERTADGNALELWDRQTGRSVSTKRADPDGGRGLFFFREGVVAFQLGREDGHASAASSIVMRVADGLTLELDGAWQAFWVFESGAVLLVREATFDSYVLDVGSVEPRWLEDYRAYNPSFEDDAIAYLEDQADLDLTYPPAHDRLQTLFHQPIDGSPRERVISEVHQPLQLGDGRYVTIRDYAGDSHGELVLLDPDDSGARVIDHDVHMYFARFADDGTGTADFHTDEMSFVYPVRDSTGDRTGLWHVQIAPRDADPR